MGMSVMAGVPRLAVGLGLLLVRQASKWKEDLIMEEGFVRKSLDLLVGSLHPSLTALNTTTFKESRLLFHFYFAHRKHISLLVNSSAGP